MNFGTQLRKWRRQAITSRQGLAERVGVTAGAVKLWERGQGFPRNAQCEKLYAITHLDCFGPWRAEARDEHERMIPPLVKKKRRTEYQENAEARRAASRKSWRERYERQRQIVAFEELTALRADPRSRKGVCRNCGQILRDVGPHLGHCPAAKMKVADYKKKWGFLRSRNATRSKETNTKQSDTMKRIRHRPPAWTHGFLPQAQVASLRTNQPGSARLEERMDAHERKLPARPHHWKRNDRGEVVSDAQIAQLRLSGLSVEEIAERVGMTLTPVWYRLKRLGFPRRARMFFHGEPVSGKHLWSLCADFHLTKAQAIERTGVSEDWANERLTRRRADEPVSPELGRKILKLRAELKRDFRRKPSRGKRGMGRPRQFTASEESEIRARYDALLGDLRSVRQWVREGEKGLSGLWNHLCQQFRAGHFRSLQFSPQFFAWVEKAMAKAEFLDGVWIPRDLTIQFLGHDYDLSEEKIAFILSHAPKYKSGTILNESLKA